MAQLTIHVNAKPYVVGCEDGQESHVSALGALIDSKVRELGASDPSLGETRIILMGALMLADELTAAKADLVKAQAETARLADLVDRADAKAVAALEAAAQKIEAMATR